MESNKKKIQLAIAAAAGVFIIGYGLYKLNQREVIDKDTKSLRCDIIKIGKVRLVNGVIPFD